MIALLKKMENHKPLCYYIMNNGCVNEQNVVFERLDEGMNQHLKPIFIWAKINNFGVKKSYRMEEHQLI